MKFWRFFLGAAIGTGMGYTLVLLVLPTLRQPKKPRFETIYQAPVERKEEQPAA